MHSFKKQSIALLLTLVMLALPLCAMADSDEPLDDTIESDEQLGAMDDLDYKLDAMTETDNHIQDPQIDSAYMVGDALVARPLGLVATVAGFGLFIVASPFALISGSAGDAWDNMVAYPAKFTFTRPLGDFD